MDRAASSGRARRPLLTVRPAIAAGAGRATTVARGLASLAFRSRAPLVRASIAAPRRSRDLPLAAATTFRAPIGRRGTARPRRRG
jgi:hypothetical protein